MWKDSLVICSFAKIRGLVSPTGLPLPSPLSRSWSWFSSDVTTNTVLWHSDALLVNEKGLIIISQNDCRDSKYFKIESIGCERHYPERWVRRGNMIAPRVDKSDAVRDRTHRAPVLSYREVC